MSELESDSLLSVAQAAGVLGVHPNTIRAWSDAGRLRYHVVNVRTPAEVDDELVGWLAEAYEASPD